MCLSGDLVHLWSPCRGEWREPADTPSTDRRSSVPTLTCAHTVVINVAPVMVGNSFNPSTEKAEADGSL